MSCSIKIDDLPDFREVMNNENVKSEDYKTIFIANKLTKKQSDALFKKLKLNYIQYAESSGYTGDFINNQLQRFIGAASANARQTSNNLSLVSKEHNLILISVKREIPFLINTFNQLQNKNFDKKEGYLIILDSKKESIKLNKVVARVTNGKMKVLYLHK